MAVNFHGNAKIRIIFGLIARGARCAGGKVKAKTLFSMAGYTRIDLGIVKYHFDVDAGKERFEWA